MILREVVGDDSEGDEPSSRRSTGSCEQPEHAGQSTMEPRQQGFSVLRIVGRRCRGYLVLAADRVAHAAPNPNQDEQRDRSGNDQPKKPEPIGVAEFFWGIF
jgi:hypothetical protein